MECENCGEVVNLPYRYEEVRSVVREEHEPPQYLVLMTGVIGTSLLHSCDLRRPR